MNKKVLFFALLAIALVLAAQPSTTAPTAGSSALCNSAATGPLALTAFKGTAVSYYWSATDGGCFACAANCVCAVAGPGGCDSCLTPGYTMVNGACVVVGGSAPSTTNTGAANCVSYCIDPVNKTSGCSACTAGYGNWLNNCVACSSNCAQCTFTAASTSTCSTCSAGYYLVSGACVACKTTSITNCAACDVTGSNCTGCSAGYFLVSGACVACPTGATACSAANVPTTCADGYYLAPATSTTTNPTCTKCPTNCRLCNAPATSSATAVCTVCSQDPNFVLSNDWVGVYLTSAGACSACTASTSITCNSTGATVVC